MSGNFKITEMMRDSFFVVIFLLSSCYDSKKSELLNSLYNSNDCWISIGEIENGKRKIFQGGTYDFGKILKKDNLGYFISYSFPDSSIYFVQPFLRDATPSSLKNCSFEWTVSLDSIINLKWESSKDIDYHKVYFSSKDTILLEYDKNYMEIFARMPIKDTSFIPSGD